MDEVDAGGEAPAVIALGDGAAPEGEGGGRADPVAYSLALGRRICSRVAAGESLGTLCQEPGMPHRGSISRWCEAHPRFGEELAAAKTAGGRLARSAQLSTYDPVVAFEICERICEGETLVAICRDAAMPGFSTVYRWRRTFPAFADMLREAREVAAERFCDQGIEIAGAVTPQTAYATHVRLTHLRWTTAVMSPGRYGRMKAVEPPVQEAPTLLVKHFTIEERESDGATRVVSWVPNPQTGLAERSGTENPWSLPILPPGVRQLTDAEERERWGGVGGWDGARS